MVNEKINDEPEQNLKEPTKPKPVAVDEKTEVDLRELQIKLEKIKGYIVKTDGRVKKHEMALQKLREKMLEIEGNRQETSILTRHKLKEDV
jgi:hypothetical protein